MRLTGASRRFHVPTGAAVAKGSGPGGCEGGRGGATYRAAAACQGPVLGGWLEGVPALRAGTETLASPSVCPPGKEHEMQRAVENDRMTLVWEERQHTEVEKQNLEDIKLHVNEV